MIKDIGQMEEGATILLHACAHNPTGVDPTAEQWDEISEVIARFLNLFRVLKLSFYESLTTIFHQYSELLFRWSGRLLLS